MTHAAAATRDGASFRDPSGFVFRRDGVLYRQVAARHAAHYRRAVDSGLYVDLAREGLLVAQEEVGLEHAAAPGAVAVLRPEPLPFVSHPYEWGFAQLRAAALLTLRVQIEALARGMTLKDASAYNVQFVGHRAVFIDHLSFEVYEPGRPWVAYRQFCEHFVAPLALAAHGDVRWLALLRSWLEGVPLDFASRALPWRTRLRPGLFAHLHLHARYQRAHADDARAPAEAGRAARARVSERGMQGLVASLESTVRGLALALPTTAWGDYYADTNYDDAAFAAKRAAVAGAIDGVQPRLVFDLGANTGVFTRLASERGAYAVAFDVDAAAVERAYEGAVERRDERLLPLRLDLANPSPDQGFAHDERASLASRGPADLVLALALVHHLAIGANVPLDRIAAYFARLGRALVVEFVPKSDSQVARMLATREDVFPDYARAPFEAAFAPWFAIESATAIEGSERVLYRMTRRAG
ncbi:MAG: SAM-dependent methyltransferase [Myxococcota bacterium]